MAYETEIADLATWKWDRVGFSENAKIEHRELVRSYGGIRDDLLASMLDYLDTLATVTNPVADGRTYQGLYRVAGHMWDQQAERYFQTLRLGWATTVLAGSSPNDECLVAQATDSRTDQRTMTLLWKNIAASPVSPGTSATHAVQVELRTQGTFSSPTIQGETKTGTWAIGAIAEQQQEDGSYWVTAVCTKVASITAASDLAALTPLRQDTEDVDSAFGLEGGNTSDEGNRKRYGIVFTYPALALASRTVILGLTNKNYVDTLLNDTEDDQYEFVAKELKDEGDGTLTLRVGFAYIPLATDIAEGTATGKQHARFVKLERSNQSGKTVLTRSWPRINPANVDTIMANAICAAVTITNPKADDKTYSGVYIVKTTQSPMTDNDGVRIVQELTLEGDASIDVYSGPAATRLRYEAWRWETTETAVNTFLQGNAFPDTTPSTKPGTFTGLTPNWNTAEVGIVKQVTTSNNADGSVNLHALWEKIEQSELDEYTRAEDADGTLAESVSEQLHPVIDAAAITTLQDDTRAAGEVLDIETEKDKDSGLVRVRRKKHTEANQTASDAVESAVESVAIVKDSAADAAAESGERSQGQVIEVGNERTKGGKYKRFRKVTTEKDQTANDEAKGLGRVESVEKHEAGDAEATTGAAAIGKQIVVKNVRTRGGKVKSEKATTTKTDLPHTDSEVTVHGTKTTEHSTAAAEAKTVGAATVNKRERTVQKRDPVTGEYIGAKETETATPWTSGAPVVVKDDGLVREVIKLHRNVTAIPAAGEGGRVAAKDNGLGAFDAEEIIRTLKSGSTVRNSHWSAVIDWDIASHTERVPSYTVSEHPSNNTQDGWNIYHIRVAQWRKITTKTVVTYSLSHPTATESEATEGEEGAGTHQFKDAKMVAEGLYALYEQERVITEWSDPVATTTWLYKITLQTPS